MKKVLIVLGVIAIILLQLLIFSPTKLNQTLYSLSESNVPKNVTIKIHERSEYIKSKTGWPRTTLEIGSPCTVWVFVESEYDLSETTTSLSIMDVNFNPISVHTSDRFKEDEKNKHHYSIRFDKVNIPVDSDPAIHFSTMGLKPESKLEFTSKVKSQSRSGIFSRTLRRIKSV